MGSGKAGGVPGILRDVWEVARFGLHLGLSCHAVRQQFLELLRRDAPRPAARVGVAANVLDGGAGRQAVFVTMERAPRPNSGLWMRIDIFGRDGYRQTFYPFWRDPEVFHDFLAICADIAESPVRDACQAEGSDTSLDEPAIDEITLEPVFMPVGRQLAEPSRPREVLSGWRRLTAWIAARLSKRAPARGGRTVIRSPRAEDPARPRPAGPGGATSNENETPEPDTHAIQTTARRGEQIQGKCTLLRFNYLEEVLDHVLLTGHRVAVKVVAEGPDLWAVIWRRADGGLYLRWGGLEHPAGPVYRESPHSLYEKLGEYELDLERVWSQARPPAV